MERSTILTAVMLGLASGVWAEEAAVAPDPVAKAIEAMRQAKDPSGVIAALVDGLEADGGDVRLHRAYLREMIAFGQPELADDMARRLVELDPNDGLGWSVIAYMAAERNQLPEAAGAMVRAVRHLPDNTFVVLTAARLLAWYDSRPTPAALDKALIEELEQTRERLARNELFVAAYEKMLGAHRAEAEEDGRLANQGAPARATPAPTFDDVGEESIDVSVIYSSPGFYHYRPYWPYYGLHGNVYFFHYLGHRSRRSHYRAGYRHPREGRFDAGTGRRSLRGGSLLRRLDRRNHVRKRRALRSTPAAEGRRAGQNAPRLGRTRRSDGRARGEVRRRTGSRAGLRPAAVGRSRRGRGSTGGRSGRTARRSGGAARSGLRGGAGRGGFSRRR